MWVPATRVMVADCDLHQGNGTAHILHGKDYVLTFSIHQMDIYPAEKMESRSISDSGRAPPTEEYLASLRGCIPRLYDEYAPEAGDVSGRRRPL